MLGAEFRCATPSTQSKLADHKSHNDSQDSRFWLNPYGVAFDHICVSDLLCIDHEGKVVEGGKPGDGQICE